MHADQPRSTFIASRPVSRLLISTAWLPGTHLAELSVEPGEDGRLTVGDRDGTQIDVNIAYSDELLVVAFSDAYDVGVDIQRYGRADADDLAWSALSPYENAYLMATPAEERAWQYLRMWTLKEALGKCLGAGSAMDPAGFDTLFDSEPLNAPPARHGQRHRTAPVAGASTAVVPPGAMGMEWETPLGGAGSPQA